MYYRYGGSFIGTMTETNRYVRAYREGTIPFVVNQSIWMEGETRFADIVLPACTNFERWDIGDWAHASGYGMHKFEQVNHRLIVLEQKCIEPLGESKPDYEIFAALAGKLGIGDLYTEGGHTELDWVKRMFDASDLPEHVPGGVRGQGLLPRPGEGRHASTPALRWFAEGRRKDTPDWGPPPWDQVGGHGLATPVGQDRVRQLEPQAVLRVGRRGRRGASGARPAVHRELGGPPHGGAHGEVPAAAHLAAPALQLPHHRRRQGRLGRGHRGPPRAQGRRLALLVIRLNPEDAEARGIAEGDLVRAFNDRGSVILCARVTGKIRPGTVHSFESCADYTPTGEQGYSPDRAGCINILTSKRFITPTSPGQACNTCLIEVERLDD